MKVGLVQQVEHDMKPIPQELWSKVVETYLNVKSFRKTANICNISKSGVEYILKQRNIEKFPRIRNGKESSIRKSIDTNINSASFKIRDFSTMNELYINKKMSLPEISKLLNISTSAIYNGLQQCGIKIRSRSEALNGKPKFYSRGEKHKDWKGGVSGWRKRARKLLNPYFVRPVMERDQFKCKWCNSTNKLVVHHHKRSFVEIVNLFKNAGLPEEELIYKIVNEHKLEDGITLCKICHDNYHKVNGK